MEFWGVEVKSGTPLKVQPEFLKLIHISQVSLGEVKDVKGAKNIPIRLKIGDQNFIFGSLSAEDRPQMMVDLVFEKEFELSHDWKNGSVYFMGYVADPSHSDDDSADDFPFEDEDDLMENRGDGLIKPKAEDALIKPKAEDGIVSNGAANAETKKDAEMKKEESSDSDVSDEEDDSEDDSDADMELGGAQEEDASDSDDSGEDSLEEDSSEEELPNPKQSKKRAAEESPVATKKAKSSTPGKTGNKKVQNATPFPSKAAGKTPAGGKSKQSPKSGGQFSGKSGNKAFNSKSGKGKRGGK